MSLLRVNETKAFLASLGALTDVSEKLRTFEGSPLAVEWSATNSAIYLGYRHKFNHRYVKVKTPSVSGAVMSVDYWDGSAWSSFNQITDETSGFNRSGFITWDEPSEWVSDSYANVPALSSVSSAEKMYWVRITLSEDNAPDVDTEIEAIQFVLSDDRALAAIYPEIMNYLPSGKTDFLEQHEQAKNLIVTELKVKGLIAYQEQIKNPDDWFMAASYKALEVIFAAITGDERLDMAKEEFRKNAAKYIAISSAALDRDKSETLDDDENPEAQSPTAGVTGGWATR